jgi:hypothetical protein
MSSEPINTGTAPAPGPAKDTASGGDIAMPRWLHVFGQMVERAPGLWVRLADLESRALAERLAEVPIDRPVYISGLARAGSTILLELLAAHPDLASHQYRDFPPLYTPVWWNWFVDRARSGQGRGPAVERAHKDGILVTPESPEAMEEVLWMRFFPDCHDPQRSNVLDAGTANPDFERFYRDHIRKILLVRGGRRYLSKGNYNVTRLGYLLRLFPDARFVVPVRDPAGHIASLIKQHRLFCREETRDPRILGHMRRVGHYEFGLDRRPVNAGDDAATAAVLRLWRDGEELRGWARYWAALHDHVAAALERDAELRRHTLVVHYHDLCTTPAEALRRVYDHCALAVDDARLAEQAARLAFPTYYKAGFTDAEAAVIAEETAATVARLRALA